MTARPTAAAGVWPYAHRTVAEVDAWEAGFTEAVAMIEQARLRMFRERGVPVRILPGGIVEFDGTPRPDTIRTVPLSASRHTAAPLER